MKNWFVKWFDTQYYHILYKDRDYQEAGMFIDNITSYLNLPENAKVLDLACGKGRHSVYLNKLGFEVTGADLSENSINQAQKNKTKPYILWFMICESRLSKNLMQFSIYLRASDILIMTKITSQRSKPLKRV